MSYLRLAERPPGPGIVLAPPEPDRPAGHLLGVQLLGRFQVRLDEVPVEEWPSGRGRSLFKYLVCHRDPWPRREQLMDAFWPEAAPAAARNSLNVAMHGLRRAFRASAEVPVVVLESGTWPAAAGWTRPATRPARPPSTSGPSPSTRATSWPTTRTRTGR
jgi:hypothetical protein